MRSKLFISHAQPEDNAFARWLYFKLTALGYDVWCELQTLRPGEYFWDEIDKVIRKQTAKFLFVMSGTTAVKRGGIYDEFDFARSIADDDKLDRFIYLLKIDSTPPNSRIGQHRINSIDFEQSWAHGLNSLIKELEKDKVPKSKGDHETVALQWKAAFRKEQTLIEKEELYLSNWFPVKLLPRTLNFHKFENLIPNTTPVWRFRYPTRCYKEYRASFADCYDFLENFNKLEMYDEEQTIKISVEDVLNGEYDSAFISNLDAKNIIHSLLNKAFDLYFQANGLRRYKLASKQKGFWYEKESLVKDKIDGVKMIGHIKQGKDRKINWHFGISGNAKLSRPPIFVIKSHIFFTEDGKKLIDSTAIQHRARRKQGKNWWNKQWKEKLLHFLHPFTNETGCIVVAVGQKQTITISATPLIFCSPVTYIDPNEEYLPEENVTDIEGQEEERFETLHDETDGTYSVDEETH